MKLKTTRRGVYDLKERPVPTFTVVDGDTRTPLPPPPEGSADRVTAGESLIAETDKPAATAEPKVKCPGTHLPGDSRINGRWRVCGEKAAIISSGVVEAHHTALSKTVGSGDRVAAADHPITSRAEMLKQVATMVAAAPPPKQSLEDSVATLFDDQCREMIAGLERDREQAVCTLAEFLERTEASIGAVTETLRLFQAIR